MMAQRKDLGGGVEIVGKGDGGGGEEGGVQGVHRGGHSRLLRASLVVAANPSGRHPLMWGRRRGGGGYLKARVVPGPGAGALKTYPSSG